MAVRSESPFIVMHIGMHTGCVIRIIAYVNHQTKKSRRVWESLSFQRLTTLISGRSLSQRWQQNQAQRPNVHSSYGT